MEAGSSQHELLDGFVIESALVDALGLQDELQQPSEALRKRRRTDSELPSTSELPHGLDATEPAPPQQLVRQLTTLPEHNTSVYGNAFLAIPAQQTAQAMDISGMQQGGLGALGLQTAVPADAGGRGVGRGRGGRGAKRGTKSLPQAGAPLGYSGGGGGQGGAGVPPASVGLPFTLVDAPFKARHNHHLGATPKVHVNSPAVAQWINYQLKSQWYDDAQLRDEEEHGEAKINPAQPDMPLSSLQQSVSASAAAGLALALSTSLPLPSTLRDTVIFPSTIAATATNSLSTAAAGLITQPQLPVLASSVSGLPAPLLGSSSAAPSQTTLSSLLKDGLIGQQNASVPAPATTSGAQQTLTTLLKEGLSGHQNAMVTPQSAATQHHLVQQQVQALVLQQQAMQRQHPFVGQNPAEAATTIAIPSSAAPSFVLASMPSQPNTVTAPLVNLTYNGISQLPSPASSLMGKVASSSVTTLPASGGGGGSGALDLNMVNAMFPMPAGMLAVSGSGTMAGDINDIMNGKLPISTVPLPQQPNADAFYHNQPTLGEIMAQQVPPSLHHGSISTALHGQPQQQLFHQAGVGSTAALQSYAPSPIQPPPGNSTQLVLEQLALGGGARDLCLLLSASKHGDEKPGAGKRGGDSDSGTEDDAMAFSAQRKPKAPRAAGSYKVKKIAPGTEVLPVTLQPPPIAITTRELQEMGPPAEGGTSVYISPSPRQRGTGRPTVCMCNRCQDGVDGRCKGTVQRNRTVCPRCRDRRCPCRICGQARPKINPPPLCPCEPPRIRLVHLDDHEQHAMVVEATASAEAKATKARAAAAAAAVASAIAAAAAASAASAAAEVAVEVAATLEEIMEPEVKVSRPKVEVYADNERDEDEDDLEGAPLDC